MHKIQTLLILALLMVPAVSRAQYDTYIWKADSLFMSGEYDQSSAMFDKAFQTGQPIDGRHLYNAAWKEHLTYNPSSIATYFNIANAYAYIFKDSEQAKAYYQQFLDLARKEENPTDQLKEMMEKAAEMLETKVVVKKSVR